MSSLVNQEARISDEFREPMVPFAIGGAGPDQGGSSDLPLSYYWNVLLRYRWRILTFVVVVTAAVGLGALAVPKEYEAVSLLRIDPSGPHTIGEEGQRSGQPDGRSLVATEARVITSPDVLLHAIESQHLERVPEFLPLRDAQRPPAEREDLLLRNVAAHVSVDQPFDTYLLEVHFRSRSSDLAARVANEISRSFLDHEYRTRAQALEDSSRGMALQREELRAQMERSQQKLVAYESQHDVLDPDDKSNVMQARLSQINEDLSAAQSARMRIEAERDTIKDGDLDAIMVSPRGQGLVPLRSRLLDDRRQLARLAQIYGPNHPLYREQAGLVEQDTAMLDAEQRHIARQVEAEYLSAKARETLIRGSLEQQRLAMDDFNRRAITYHALKGEADSATKLFYDLQQRIQDANVAANLRSEDLRIIGVARPPDRAVYPRPLFAAGLAFLLSSMIGIGVVLAIGAFDTTVTSPERLEQFSGVRVLAALPLISGEDWRNGATLGQRAQMLGEIETGAVPMALQVISPFHEGMLTLHTNIMLAFSEPPKVLSVTSSRPGEGKSTITAHLATIFANLGTRVLLVDGDMRKPTVHRTFKVPNQRGLSDVLRGRVTWKEVIQVPTEVHNLTLLTAGPSTTMPSELLSLGLAETLEQLRNEYDIVIIDCPPALGFADSSAIASLSDAIIVVAQAGGVSRDQVMATLRQLRGSRASVTGIVLNRMEARYGGYYASGELYEKYYRNSVDED
ncbi:MAG: GumC family protein [Terriglobales bacterium]